MLTKAQVIAAFKKSFPFDGHDVNAHKVAFGTFIDNLKKSHQITGKTYDSISYPYENRIGGGMNPRKHNSPIEEPGTRAAIARKIRHAESALQASIGRLESEISYLHSGSALSQPGNIGRAAADVELRRGILLGLRDAADTW